MIIRQGPRSPQKLFILHPHIISHNINHIKSQAISKRIAMKKNETFEGESAQTKDTSRHVDKPIQYWTKKLDKASFFHLSFKQQSSRVKSSEYPLCVLCCVTVITTILCFIDMRAWGSGSVCDDGVRKEGSIQYKIYTSRLSAHFYFWVVCVYNVQYYYHSLSNGYFLYENEWKLDRKQKWRKEKVA